MDANRTLSGRHVQHIAHAEQLFGTLFAQNGTAVDFGSDLKADTGREIGFNRAGNDVDGRPLGGHDQMQAGGARHLGQALDCGFNVFAGNQHKVCHFVNDNYNIRQRREVKFLFFENRFAGFGVEACLYRAFDFFAAGFQFLKFLVVTGNVADIELSHGAVTVFHFLNRPFEADNGFGRVGNDRRQQMRNAVVH